VGVDPFATYSVSCDDCGAPLMGLGHNKRHYEDATAAVDAAVGDGWRIWRLIATLGALCPGCIPEPAEKGYSR